MFVDSVRRCGIGNIRESKGWNGTFLNRIQLDLELCHRLNISLYVRVRRGGRAETRVNFPKCDSFLALPSQDSCGTSRIQRDTHFSYMSMGGSQSKATVHPYTQLFCTYCPTHHTSSTSIHARTHSLYTHSPEHTHPSSCKKSNTDKDVIISTQNREAQSLCVTRHHNVLDVINGTRCRGARRVRRSQSAHTEVDMVSRKSFTMTLAAAMVVMPRPVAITYWNARRESPAPGTPVVLVLYGSNASTGTATCFSRRWSARRQRHK